MKIPLQDLQGRDFLYQPRLKTIRIRQFCQIRVLSCGMNGGGESPSLNGICLTECLFCFDRFLQNRSKRIAFNDVNDALASMRIIYRHTGPKRSRRAKLAQAQAVHCLHPPRSVLPAKHRHICSARSSRNLFLVTRLPYPVFQGERNDFGNHGRTNC